MARHSIAKCLAALASPFFLGGCVMLPSFPSWEMLPPGVSMADIAGSETASPAIEARNLVLDASENAIIEATIDGHPVTLQVDTGHSGITLNGAAAQRIGLQQSMLPYSIRVGPRVIEGQSAVADVVIEQAVSRQRVRWIDAPVSDIADGVITMANLPYASITMRLREDAPDDVAFTLQTEPRDYSIVHRLPVQDRRLDIRFLLDAPETYITTAASAHLANTQNGRWAGETVDHPIAYGIARPVRPMAFANPLAIGALSLDRALVRMRDYEGGERLPQDPEPELPSDAIVVPGTRDRSDPEYFVTVGRDVLHACASITYIRETRQLALRCAPSR